MSLTTPFSSPSLSRRRSVRSGNFDSQFPATGVPSGPTRRTDPSTPVTALSMAAINLSSESSSAAAAFGFLGSALFPELKVSATSGRTR